MHIGTREDIFSKHFHIFFVFFLLHIAMLGTERDLAGCWNVPGLLPAGCKSLTIPARRLVTVARCSAAQLLRTFRALRRQHGHWTGRSGGRQAVSMSGLGTRLPRLLARWGRRDRGSVFISLAPAFMHLGRSFAKFHGFHSARRRHLLRHSLC